MVGFGRRNKRERVTFLNDRVSIYMGAQSRFRLSVALPLEINAPIGRFTTSLYPTFELNPAVRKTARAGRLPSGGTHSVFYWPPLPHDSTSRASDPPQSTANSLLQFCRVRAARSGGGPNGPARKPGGSTNRKGTTNSSAQRGAKTATGFRTRRTVAAQSTAQFFAPCPPHCGSAVAPPVPLGTRKMGGSAPKRRPRQFYRIGRVPIRQNMPS